MSKLIDLGHCMVRLDKYTMLIVRPEFSDDSGAYYPTVALEIQSSIDLVALRDALNEMFPQQETQS